MSYLLVAYDSDREDLEIRNHLSEDELKELWVKYFVVILGRKEVGSRWSVEVHVFKNGIRLFEKGHITCDSPDGWDGPLVEEMARIYNEVRAKAEVLYVEAVEATKQKTLKDKEEYDFKLKEQRRKQYESLKMEFDPS